MAATLNLIYLLAFVGLVIVSLGRMVRRVGWYLRARQSLDVILARDVALFGAFAFSFVMILAIRAFGLTEAVRDNPAWSSVTALPVIISLAYWTWVEYTQVDG